MDPHGDRRRRLRCMESANIRELHFNFLVNYIQYATLGLVLYLGSVSTCQQPRSNSAYCTT